MKSKIDFGDVVDDEVDHEDDDDDDDDNDDNEDDDDKDDGDDDDRYLLSLWCNCNFLRSQSAKIKLV